MAELKNVTLSLPADVVAQARVAAALESKSLSRFVSDLVAASVSRRRTQLEALEAFLAGPLMDLTDEDGKTPSRDQLYD